MSFAFHIQFIHSVCNRIHFLLSCCFFIIKSPQHKTTEYCASQIALMNIEQFLLIRICYLRTAQLMYEESAKFQIEIGRWVHICTYTYGAYLSARKQSDEENDDDYDGCRHNLNSLFISIPLRVSAWLGLDEKTAALKCCFSPPAADRHTLQFQSVFNYSTATWMELSMEVHTVYCIQNNLISEPIILILLLNLIKWTKILNDYNDLHTHMDMDNEELLISPSLSRHHLGIPLCNRIKSFSYNSFYFLHPFQNRM